MKTYAYDSPYGQVALTWQEAQEVVLRGLARASEIYTLAPPELTEDQISRLEDLESCAAQATKEEA